MMTRLRAFRANAHPLLLIAVWTLLEAATIAWSALAPGEPHYSSSGTGSLGTAIFTTGLIILGVVVGSKIAWWLAIFFDTLGVALGVIVGIVDSSPGAWGVAVLQAAALWLIWSGSIERYVSPGLFRAQIRQQPQ